MTRKRQASRTPRFTSETRIPICAGTAVPQCSFWKLEPLEPATMKREYGVIIGIVVIVIIALAAVVGYLAVQPNSKTTSTISTTSQTIATSSQTIPVSSATSSQSQTTQSSTSNPVTSTTSTGTATSTSSATSGLGKAHSRCR